MDKCRHATISISPGITIFLNPNSQLENIIAYRQLIGSLLYLTISRPDIAYVVNMMERFI